MTRRLRGRPGSHGGACNSSLDAMCTRQTQEHLRCVIVCLVPLGVLPRILGRVQTVVPDVSVLLPQSPPSEVSPLTE